MEFQIGDKNPSIMMVGNRHVKKASMFERKSQTTYNIDHSKMSYTTFNELLIEPLNEPAYFIRSSYNKSNRTLTFSSIRVFFTIQSSSPPPTGMIGASITIGLTGKVYLYVTNAHHLDPSVISVTCEATNVTIQFSYSEWNQIYTETTNSWWEEKVVYERQKRVHVGLIPYSTSPAGKDFTITYGSTSEGSRRLNNVTMTHESDFYGGISINIAGSLYPTTRTLLSSTTEIDISKVPFFIYDGLTYDTYEASYHSLDVANRKINGLRFIFKRDYAFDGAYIGVGSGNNSWAAPWEFNGSHWVSIVEFDVPVGYTTEEWNQFVITTNIYKYTMSTSSLTFSQTDWDKFYV